MMGKVSFPWLHGLCIQVLIAHISDRGLPELCRCPLQEAPLLFTVCSAATLALRLPTLERLMQQT